MRQQYQSQVNTRRISFYSVPNNSQAIPLLRVANYINKHSYHKVKFFSSKMLIQKIRDQYPKITMVPIDDGLTQQKLTKIVKSRNIVEDYGDYFSQNWIRHFWDIENSRDQKQMPHLVVSDFNTLPAIKFAIKNDIKLIVNYPLNLSIVSILNKLPNFKNSVGFGGSTIFHPGLQISFSLPSIQSDKNLQLFQKKAIFMVNSFFGIDKPMVLPPNYIMTGAFINTFINTTQSQIRSDSKVFQWIRYMKDQGKQDFIYVNFGSSLKLSEQFIKVVYQGLKRLNLPIIWSLKSQFAKLIQGQNFFVEDWLPQQKLLQRDEIKVFLNHGSWNCINQSIFHAKPMVIIPSFADQQFNAHVLQQNKIAVVINVKKPHILPIDNKIQLTSDQVRKSIRKVMSQVSYKQNALRLSKISNLTNGFQIYKTTIDITLQSGYQHLIDQNHIKVTHRKGFDTFKIILGVATVALIYKHNWVEKLVKDFFN